MRLCRFRHAAGVPRTGIHARRLPCLDVALWDVVATVLVAVVLSRWFDVRFVKAFGTLMVVGTLCHWLFCVDTAVIVRLGLQR